MRSAAKDVKGLGREVKGAISSSGGIISGTGFSVVRTGVGAYTVTFAVPFSTTPTISVTPRDFISNNSWGLSAYGPSIFNINFGGAVDHDFNFIAREMIQV